MPDSYGPWNTAWSNSIALCTVIRDENETDIQEWIQYYKWLGVDHIYLTENGSERPVRAAIAKHINSGFVTYDTQDEPHAQLQTYRRCLIQYRHLYNWMAFFDADEYLSLRGGEKSIKHVLDDYKAFPGLAVHWIFLGANGRDRRPEHGGVLRHYTTCWPEPLAQIKVIANTFFVQGLSQHPHNFFFWGKAAPVNEGRFPIANRILGRSCVPGKKACFLTAGHEQTLPAHKSVNRLALFHYVTRSLEDFKIKSRRGGGNDKRGKSQQFFDALQQGMQDEPICKELSQLADACCSAT